MTKPHLSACPACARHVRVSEARCPFCAAALSDAFRATPAPRRIAARLSRAALFALGTAGAAAAALACSEDPESATLDPNCCRDAYGGPPYNPAFNPRDARIEGDDAEVDAASDAEPEADASDAADAGADG